MGRRQRCKRGHDQWGGKGGKEEQRARGNLGRNGGARVGRGEKVN